MPTVRHAFGAESLDRLLGGGLEAGALSELYGPGGSGKSTLCLVQAVRALKAGRWVIYLDSEGLSLDRLEQIAEGAGVTLPEVLKRLLLTSPKDLDEQERAVERACALVEAEGRRVGLVVVDSATLHYRQTFGTEDEGVARQSLSYQLAQLLHAGIEGQVPILLTNQVYWGVESGQYEPIGGTVLNHMAKCVVRLERKENGWRRAFLMRHRSLPEGGWADFRLTQDGIGDR